MRFLSVLAVAALSLAPLPSWAQATLPATATRSATNPLTVTTPPAAVVTFEADWREGDLLGLIKNVIVEMEKSMNASPTDKNPSPQTRRAVAVLAPFSSFLEGKKLSDILKDVTHVHVVIYRKNAATDSTTATAATATSAPAPLDYLAFHENLLKDEGGRRLLYANDGGRYLITAFDAPRAMAVVVDDGTRVTVVRTEGMIDFKATTAILLALGGLSAGEEETATTPATNKPAGIASPATKTAPKKPVKKVPAAKLRN